VLGLPVVAVLLGDVLDRGPRGAVGALLAVVLLVGAVQRLLVRVADVLGRALQGAGEVFLLGGHAGGLPGVPARYTCLRCSGEARGAGSAAPAGAAWSRSALRRAWASLTSLSRRSALRRRESESSWRWPDSVVPSWSTPRAASWASAMMSRASDLALCLTSSA